MAYAPKELSPDAATQELYKFPWMIHDTADVRAYPPADPLCHIYKLCQTCTSCSRGRSPMRRGNQTRSPHTFGNYNKHAKCMLVFGSPHWDEIVAGTPIAGDLLQQVQRGLHAHQLHVDDVYITNLVKCGSDADMTPEAIDSCLTYLRLECWHIQPILTVAVGPVACQGLCPDAGAAEGNIVTNLFGYRTLLTSGPASRSFNVACGLISRITRPAAQNPT